MANQPVNQLHAPGSGFTLVELAIVLVIIGLVSGAILVGKDMIRTAELRSVVTDVERYHTAIETFRGKYNGLPGDIRDATSYFKNAVNGNGDRRIGTETLMSDTEPYQVWLQLGQARLVSGEYTGKRDNPFYTFGKNAPKSKLYGTQGVAGYAFAYLSASPTGLIYAIPGNYITFGWAGGPGNTPSGAGSVLTGREAYYIDSKIDDGRMTTGRVISENGHDGGGERLGCAANNESIDDYDPLVPPQYDLNNSIVACTMDFAH